MCLTRELTPSIGDSTARSRTHRSTSPHYLWGPHQQVAVLIAVSWPSAPDRQYRLSYQSPLIVVFTLVYFPIGEQQVLCIYISGSVIPRSRVGANMGYYPRGQINPSITRKPLGWHPPYLPPSGGAPRDPTAFGTMDHNGFGGVGVLRNVCLFAVYIRCAILPSRVGMAVADGLVPIWYRDIKSVNR